MRLSLFVVAANLVLPISSVTAQQIVTCPATVNVQIQKVDAFKDDPGGGALTGFKQVFLPNAVVRLKAAYPGEGEPDNMEGKPGEPIRWTLWDGKSPAPTDTLYATCGYEGGMQLKVALNKGIRTCTSVRKEVKSTAANPSYGPTLPLTTITCR